MKKLTAAICSALTAALLLSGCGAGGQTENGTYISVNGIGNFAGEYRSNPDAAMEKVLSEETESEQTVTLQDGQFTVRKHLNAADTVTWSGTYSSMDSVLHLSYTGITAEGNVQKQKYEDRLAELNQRGAYPAWVIPRIYASDAAKTASRLPVGLMQVPDSLALTELHEDFLCVPVYGMTVDGSYQSGSEFSVNYIPADTLRNDLYSKAYWQETSQSFAVAPDEEQIALWLQITANHYGVENPDNMQFRIRFADGKWEMTAADGKTAGRGGYAESKKHPGFLSLYDEPEDPQNQDLTDHLYPLFLYIDSSNQIYYPGFIRKT